MLPLPGTAFSQVGRADEVVQRAVADGRDLPVIVRFADDGSLERGRERFSREPRAVRRHGALRALRARASAHALQGLLDDQGTSWVSYDAPVAGFQTTAAAPVPVSIESSGASSARRRYRVDGSGVRVAVIDSGLQPHADLPASRVAAFVDFVNGQIGSTAAADSIVWSTSDALAAQGVLVGETE